MFNDLAGRRRFCDVPVNLSSPYNDRAFIFNRFSFQSLEAS
jgi:hypothetical protein